ncbi:MAG TPA: aminotransferase class V-fold PLP-dependent enzyme [Planctomycetota bacterium]|nr:aminotransferase class V-fold PLP-dependent enzyme [Planctomycetota bacterium]
MTADDPLLSWRARFPITERANYLVSNSLGAMPAAARADVARFLDQWDTRGVRAWAEGWWVLQDQVAALVERVLGVAAHTVSMHQNVAVATEMILSCFDFHARRNKIVYSELNFPSDQYIHEARAAHGARLVRVPGNADRIGVDLQRLLAAIDDQTLIVAVDHVLFRSAFVVDVAAIVQQARKVGAFVILDVFHSAGTLPLELERWGVHAAVGGALKYLCGGPGNCFLYVAPAERARLQPAFTGWAAHKQPFAFSTAGQDYRDDGGRFSTGTPNVPALFAGMAGIAALLEAGIDRVRQKSQRLTQLAFVEAQRLGFGIKSPADARQRGGHLAIDVPHGYAVCQALLAEDVVVDYRPDAGLRVAPHFYNSEDEVRAAVRRTREILDRREYERFQQQERRPG